MVFVRDADTRGALRAGPAYLRLLSSFDPLARSLFSRSPEQTGLRRGLISRALKKKRAAGILSRGDCLWYMAGADSTIARQNWLSSSFTLTAVNSPTFTADRGYKGDAVAAYLDTAYTPGSGNFTLNSALIAVYHRQGSTGGVWAGAQQGASAGLTQVQDAGADLTYRVNHPSATNTTVAGGKVAGLHVIERSSSTTNRHLLNGVQDSTASVAPDILPDRPFFLLARNAAFLPSPDPRNFTDAQLSLAFIGGSLTDAQHAALNDIATEYLTAVGAI